MTDSPLRLCGCCKISKPATAFSNSQLQKKTAHCKDCVSLKNRNYRQENAEKLNAYLKTYRATHNITKSPEAKERNKAHQKERYQNDPTYRARVKAAANARIKALPKEVVSAKNKEWRQRNPEKVRQLITRWRQKQAPERLRALGKASRNRHRVARQKDSASYYAKRYGSGDVISNQHLNMLHKWQDHCCFYCLENLAGHETIEHVVPLNRHGTNKPHNVVLACSSCNYSKGDKLFGIEWTPKQIKETPRWHSIYGLKYLQDLLTKANISWHSTLDGTAIKVEERFVFVLSSFWLGWKGADIISTLAQQYPKALLFFDKEVALRPQAIVNVIKAKAGIAQRFGARNMEVLSPSLEEAKEFISTWHAMGFAYGTHYLGLKGDKDWHAIAAIKKDIDRYEIVRMAIRETVAGGVSRIIKHLQDWMPEPLPIVAFTDARMGDGKSHDPAGFTAAGTTRRTFFYATPEEQGFKPRRAFQKPVLALKADYYDEAQTQTTLARANGIMRVEGLPLFRFELKP